MHRRKEFLFGSLIGLCVMLLALLAVVVTPRPRTALAQDNPRLAVSIGDDSMNQGDKTWVHVAFHNMPRDPNDDDAFGVYFRYYLDRNSDNAWVNADNCAKNLVGSDLYITTWYRSPWAHEVFNFTIKKDCQVGNYRLRVSAKDKSTHSEVVSGTREISVSLGPSVTIAMPSTTPFYRGTALNPTINFHNLVQGADYTYEAWLMARNPQNYAEICEGTGLDRNKTFDLNGASGNPVQKSVTISDLCPTNEYTIHAKIYDSDDRERGSQSVDFEITTDPNATPSVSVSLSESSPIAPGTEFDVTFNFYDIQPGTAVNYRDTMTNTSTNQAVGQMDCGSSPVGWGQDVGTTINRNPYVNLITIPTDCPAGSYRIVSEIEDTSGNDIISGSVDFTIGDPDLIPSAPTVSNLIAKQNSPFSQQLPVGTGGDGTLDHDATGLPPGLLFTKSTRTIAGTPTGTGPSTVRYTVTDIDGDSDYVDFTITVNPDLTPTAPAVSPLTAKQNAQFSHQLPDGSGGDGTLSYGATGLPDGLLFTEATRTIAGTPTRHGPFTVRYTVTDSDGDSAFVDFTITVNPDLSPTAPSISGISARKGSLFTRQLPVGSGGDAPLSYNATNLPTGLSFITATRTITGTPTTEQALTVTYTVRDSDGDENSSSFVFTIAADLMPALSSISGYTGRVGSPFSQVLPPATGGDTPLSYTATNLPTGLTFIASTRTIEGTPSTQETKTVTYTVRDDDGDEASTTLDIAVAADLKPTLTSITGYTGRVGSPFSQVLPAAAGGDSPLSYTAANLPTGLSFNTSTRTIQGKPSSQETKTVTYTVRDDDGDEASTTFNITVEADLKPAFSSISGFTVKVDNPFSQVLPAATGGDAPLSYTATNLPTGLTFITTTRTITGTPTTVESKTVIYTVQDEDGDEANTTFALNVAADLTPTLSTISGFTVRVNSPFSQALPQATGGDLPLSYTATNLPTGLSFVTSTRTISGTPTTVESKTVTYMVRDDDWDEDSKTFVFTVAADLTPTLPAISGYTAIANSPFSQVLPAATGGDQPLSYTATGLPIGLDFITSTRTIVGTPSSAQSPTVTYKVRDNDGDEDSQTFTFTVEADIQPSQPSIDDMHLKVGSSLRAELPAGTNGNPPYSYTISALPSGLNFDRSTRILSGRPSSAGSTGVTYTVIDVDNDSAAEDFTINVYALPDLPQFSHQSGMKDELFTLQLPAATGGRAPLLYAVTGLPSELQFITSTRVITGTPTQVEVINVNYMVTDRDNDQDSVTFKITVTDLDQSQIGNNNNNGNNNGENQGGNNPHSSDPLTVVDVVGYTATVGELFTQQLPSASGGTLPYAYSVTALPDGLDLVMINRTITGTPTITGTTVVTYTVTDGASNSASDALTITVQNAGGNQGRDSQGSNNQGSNNQGGNNQGRKGDVSQGGGSQGSGSSNTKKNSGNPGNTNNLQKYTPPASSTLPSQQQYWSGSPVPEAITLPLWLNVRRGPGPAYEIVTTVPEGTRGNIYGRNPADAWFQVKIADISNMVWICQNLTRVEGSLDEVRFLEKWEIDLIPKTADGPLAITTPAILNVRAGPGLDYEILTTVPKSTQATIVGIGPNAEWYMVALDALSKPAWVYAALTTVEGFLGGVKQYSSTEVNGYTYTEVDGPDTCSANPIAVTIPAVLNVRRGPGTEYEVITTVAKGTRAEIIGIGPQNEWLLVELDSLVEPAWIYRDLTTAEGSLAGIRQIGSGQASQPNAPTNVDRPTAVTYPSLVNIRVGPGLTYGILNAVGQGTRALIMGLSPDENWYLVEIDGLSQLGWIREDLTVLVGNLNNVKRITAAEIAMLPVAIVDTPTLNVRSGPGTGYGIVTTISEGTWTQIIGLNEQTDWFRIKLYGVTGQTWVYRDLINLAGLLAGVTQVSSSTVAEATDDYQALQATTILESASTVEAGSTRQITVNSITVEISLPSNGNIDLEVRWTDAGACTELYNIYYRSSADSATYFSLETAVIASSAQSKNLSFLTLPVNSLISAWCGTQNSGRQVAEVMIDPGVEGIYGSLPSQIETDAVALASGVELSN